MTFIVSTPEPVDGPLTGADRPMLTAYLGWQRMTLLNICAGLDGAQLATRPIASSNLSLLGLIRHLAKVERIWFRQRAGAAMAGAEIVGDMYDPARGRDADFDDLDPSEAEAAVARLRAEWLAADAAVASMSFDDEVDVHGDAFSLRMIYVHMIGEYARHNGHADLLRESLDGVTAR